MTDIPVRARCAHLVDGLRLCAQATRRLQQTYHTYDQQWENDLLSKCIRCGESCGELSQGLKSLSEAEKRPQALTLAN